MRKKEEEVMIIKYKNSEKLHSKYSIWYVVQNFLKYSTPKIEFINNRRSSCRASY